MIQRLRFAGANSQGNAMMYKADVNPQQAYDALSGNEKAVLIDVRTNAEWAFVGVPAVERLLTLSWQNFPAMQVNEQFVNAVREAGIAEDADIYCICRSGARSAAAATALTQAGLPTATTWPKGSRAISTLSAIAGARMAGRRADCRGCRAEAMKKSVRAPNPASWGDATKLVRGGLDRSHHGETAEALYLNSGFVYPGCRNGGRPVLR
jgi:rhodanese-related sulfurtransferase